MFQELQSVFITFTTHTSSSVFLNGNDVDDVVGFFSVNNDDILIMTMVMIMMSVWPSYYQQPVLHTPEIGRTSFHSLCTHLES